MYIEAVNRILPFCRRQWVAIGLALIVPLYPGPIRAATTTNSLEWRLKDRKVNADIDSWDLVQTLEKIGEATGWEIFIEPGTKRQVSTTFKNRTPEAALDLLLGDLGRILIPHTNGAPPRLLVFRSNQKEATQMVGKPKEKEDPTKKPIPNELVVTLKPGENIDELARKLGAKVVGRNDALRTYRLQFDSELEIKFHLSALNCS